MTNISKRKTQYSLQSSLECKLEDKRHVDVLFR